MNYQNDKVLKLMSYQFNKQSESKRFTSNECIQRLIREIQRESRRCVALSRS